MLDEQGVQQLFNWIMDRFSIEDICDILEITPLDILRQYQDDVLDVDWESLL